MGGELVSKKVEVKVFKGPNFKMVEKKAYGLLHDILRKKSVEKEKEQKSDII